MSGTYLIHPPNLTDLGNAQRLVIQHGGDLLFSYPLRRWFNWASTHWRVDEIGEVFRRAKRTVRGIYLEAEQCQDEERRKALAKHAARSESESRIMAMVKLAESEPGIQVLPKDLDKDRWLLNVKNGTLNLKTAELKPHDRNDLITSASLFHTTKTRPVPPGLTSLSAFSRATIS